MSRMVAATNSVSKLVKRGIGGDTQQFAARDLTGEVMQLRTFHSGQASWPVSLVVARESRRLGSQ